MARSLRARCHATAGFSLIEVLAAVAILGIWFSMLAALAMDGLRTTGESQRRLRASLLADEMLAELELKALQGERLDELGEEESRDPFTINIEVHDLTEFDDRIDTGADTVDLIGFFHHQNDSIYAEIRNGNWLLEYLREVRIEVRWEEGVDEIAITRTSYLWDRGAWGERNKEFAVESTGDADLDAFIQEALEAERSGGS